MRQSERRAAIQAAYIKCGQEEYAARMGAMLAIELAGELFDQRTRIPREDYERSVNIAESRQRELERGARLRLSAELSRLGVIQGG